MIIIIKFIKHCNCRKFRGAGAWQTGIAAFCLKDVSKSAAVTVFSRELQVLGAVQQKAGPYRSQLSGAQL